MPARMAGVTAAIALFQLMAIGPIYAQSQKPAPDAATKRQGFVGPKAVRSCSTAQGPTAFGRPCGTRPDLYECNGINTNCCPKTDDACLRGG